MDRKDTGERDASKDKSPTPGITPKGSEGAMDVRGGAAGSGGGSRQRYNSEDAASSEGISDQGKRQKTVQGFVTPGTASPPKFVSLEEIMKAANGVNKMALAHEIAVDKDFILKKVELADNSIYKQVKETLHRTFWDILDAQLKEEPPNYTQAMVLLGNVKESLLSLLLSQHTKLKEQISEVLDADLIGQQAEKGILDFQHYAQYVISVMGKLCAPVRDDKIRELTQTQGVVPVFRGILEAVINVTVEYAYKTTLSQPRRPQSKRTLDLMRLDMANFTINVFRPDIIAHSVDYEKKKFAEFLAVQTDGLQCTRKWLLRHLMNARNDAVMFSVEDKNAIQNLTTCVLGEAYLELLEWSDLNLYPETLLMDQARFTELGNRFFRLAVMGSILLVTTGTALALQGVAAFKNKLKGHITVLLEDCYTNKDLEEIMPNIAEQVVVEVAEGLETYGFKPLDATSGKLLKGQIMEIIKEGHKIRELIRMRIREFIQQSITSPTAAPVRVPPGLSSLQTELTAITGQILRLVSYNLAVFSEYYTDIIANGVSTSASVTE